MEKKIEISNYRNRLSTAASITDRKKQVKDISKKSFGVFKDYSIVVINYNDESRAQDFSLTRKRRSRMRKTAGVLVKSESSLRAQME